MFKRHQWAHHWKTRYSGRLVNKQRITKRPKTKAERKIEGRKVEGLGCNHKRKAHQEAERLKTKAERKVEGWKVGV